MHEIVKRVWSFTGYCDKERVMEKIKEIDGKSDWAVNTMKYTESA
jgi:hypothetical protein